MPRYKVHPLYSDAGEIRTAIPRVPDAAGGSPQARRIDPRSYEGRAVHTMIVRDAARKRRKYPMTPITMIRRNPTTTIAEHKCPCGSTTRAVFHHESGQRMRLTCAYCLRSVLLEWRNGAVLICGDRRYYR